MALINKLRLLQDIIMLKLGYPRMFSITINMTDKCNLRCKMCNIWARQTKNEIKADVFEKQMKESKTMQRVKLFNFAGGEPFLVKDLDKFVSAVAKHSKPIQVRFVTNGFLTNIIAEKMEEFLEEHKDMSLGVKISLDGTENTHDHIRGIKGSFANVVKTIDKLNELKEKYGNRLGINIGFTVNKINFREVNDIYNLAMKKNVGFLFKPIMRIRKFSNEESVGDLFLNQQEVDELIAYNKRFLKEGKIGEGFMEKMVYKHFYRIMNKYMKEPRNYITCYALSGSCYVIPNGDVTSCLLLNDVFGNLNERNFDEIWMDERSVKRRKEILNGGCHCLTPCDTIPSLMVDKFPFY
ncbi:radical SAM protein [Candidatus Woesearchaeota archaeon]|nr:radical SAM protein [Candidatus Woesearchaeota archaeon]